MRATLSIWGLYNYDNTVFDDLVIPEELDRNEVIGTILADCVELEIIYPDPAVMKAMIKTWSTHCLPVWERVLKAINVDYAPLENYNRTEDITGLDTGSSTATGNAIDRHQVTGYNSGSFVDQSKDISEAANNGSSSVSTTRKTVTRGNIGVTTSQQMLNQELDVAERTDIYSYISRSFKNKFCLMVY